MLAQLEHRWVWFMTFFPVFCRVTKSPRNFFMCHMVYFNNMKRKLGYLSYTWGPPRPKDRSYCIRFMGGGVVCRCMHPESEAVNPEINVYVNI